MQSSRFPAPEAEYHPVRPEELERSNFPPLKNDAFLRAARGEQPPFLPVWLMRQAGRYLPEYHSPGPAGAEKPDFFTRCNDAGLSAQTTLQPLARFAIDAAVIFSDILTVPKALGRELKMIPERGPVFDHKLELTDTLKDVSDPSVMEALQPIMRALTVTRHRLQGHVPVIGFTGGPLTLFLYMVEGASSKVWNRGRSWLYAHREESHGFLQKLTDCIVIYLVEQVRAGAQALQVFESNAGVLGPDMAEEYLIPYMNQIASRVRQALHEEGLPNVPLIAFPRECPYALFGLEASDYDAVSLDWVMQLNNLPLKPHTVGLQGNLDPAVLYAPLEEIPMYVARMIGCFPEDQGHIVNLGHGMYKDMSPDAVEAFVNAVHNMDLSRRFRIGTRSSALAMVQTNQVWNGLTAAAPTRIFHRVPLQTVGDAAPEASFTSFTERNIFSSSLEKALCEGKVDIIVHSLKDLSATLTEGTVLGAILPRASVQDMLVVHSSLKKAKMTSVADLPPKCKVGTSSPRRAAQLLALRPDLVIVSVRGNIQTRLRKLESGQDGLQALVVAEAALDRLHRSALGQFVLPFVSAVAQGAIGVQCRGDDKDVVELLAKIDHKPSRLAVAVERALARDLKLSCHSAAGIYAQIDADSGACVVTVDFLKQGEEKRIAETFADAGKVGSEEDAVAVAAKLGDKLRKQGVEALLK